MCAKILHLCWLKYTNFIHYYISFYTSYSKIRNNFSIYYYYYYYCFLLVLLFFFFLLFDKILFFICWLISQGSIGGLRRNSLSRLSRPYFNIPYSVSITNLYCYLYFLFTKKNPIFPLTKRKPWITNPRCFLYLWLHAKFGVSFSEAIY